MASYRDLIIMSISAALSTRFRQVNKTLLAHKGNPMAPSFYHEQRLFYRKLASLTGDIDRAFLYVITLSLADNLFLREIFLSGIK